jgi:hypothetical protein
LVAATGLCAFHALPFFYANRPVLSGDTSLFSSAELAEDKRIGTRSISSRSAESAGACFFAFVFTLFCRACAAQ